MDLTDEQRETMDVIRRSVVTGGYPHPQGGHVHDGGTAVLDWADETKTDILYSVSSDHQPGIVAVRINPAGEIVGKPVYA